MTALYNDKRTKSKKVNSLMLCLRLNQHLTQEQVAKMAGLDRGYYVKIENGQCIASVKAYRDIAIALGYPNWKNLIPNDRRL